MNSLHNILLGLLAVLVVTSATLHGVEKRTSDPMPITPEREAAALTFVQINHPELTELLKGLKKQNKSLYQKAIRELYRHSERLSMFVQRDQVRYEAELRAWKVGSRIQLASAQYKTATSEKDRGQLEQKLRVLLAEQAEAKLAILQHERKRIQLRLDRIDEQVNRIRDSQEESIESQVKQLTKQRFTPVSKKRSPEKEKASSR